MKNVNLELVQKVLGRRVAPIVLATMLTIGAATPQAKAANVDVTTVTITSEGYITESNSKPYVDNKDEYTVKNLINKINNDYENIYTVLANGGMSLMNTNYDASKARMLAFIANIESKYTTEIGNLGSSGKNVIEKHLKSKSNEAKVLYSSVTTVPVSELEKYSKNKQCIFGSNTNGNLVDSFVVVYETIGNKLQQTANYTYNANTNEFRLLKMPNVVVTNAGSTSFKVNTTYKGVVVYANSYETYNNIINNEADPLYDKIENAINKGNYTKKNTLSTEQVYMSIYGDTNLIKNSLDTKYIDANIRQVISEYASYRQQDLLAKVAKKNNMNFDNMTGNNHTNTIRQYESGGLVVYGLSNGTTSAINDQKHLTTAGLTVTGQGPTIPNVPGQPSNGLENKKITVTTVNIKYNDVHYFPTDVNGTSVQAMAHNGTTYLPVRSICSIFGAEIEWNKYSPADVIITRKSTQSFTYNMSGYNYTGYNTNLKYGSGSIVQPTSSNIDVQTGAKLFYNGVLQTLRDVNGNIVPIITRNGTTYAPARPLVNMFGSKIDYDEPTNIVYIGDSYIMDQPSVVPPTNTETPNYPTGGSNQDPGYQAYDTVTQKEVRIYKDSNGLRYVIENGTKRIISTEELLNRYQIGTATYEIDGKSR